MLNRKIYFVILLFLGNYDVSAQQFYRIKADISIKDKLSNGQYRLTVGKAYYDKIYQKIIYKLNFPEKETIVIQDTTLYKLDKDNKLVSAKKSVVVADFTIFHLALTGRISDYGLKTTEQEMYKITKVEKEKDQIITTWTPIDARLAKILGKIMMSNVNKHLDAIVFYDVKGKILSRQFFKNYTNIKGVEFPQQVTMISIDENGKENIQQTTYKNILIDQSNEDEIYRYRIPISQSVGNKK